MRIRAVFAVLGLSLIPFLSLAQSKQASSASTSQLKHNLIKNGDVKIEGKDSSHVPAWGEQDGLTEVAYGSTGGEWDWGLSGCAACGKAI